MRKDMFKVIVERPRSGGKYDKKRTKNESREDLPSKESMRKSHIDRKELNENLAPLRRFIEKSIGRPWNKVFSEICANISVKSTVQQHVRQHVTNYVELEVRIDGKRILRKNASYGHYYELSNGDMYVHPTTGILRKYKCRDLTPATKPVDRGACTALANALSSLMGKSKSKTIFRDGAYWKVHKNKITGAWDVFNLATAAHARTDWSSVRYSIYSENYEYTNFFHTYKKELSETTSSYLKGFYAYYLDLNERRRREKEEDKKVAEAKLRQASESPFPRKLRTTEEG